jgi:hypothetical protein
MSIYGNAPGLLRPSWNQTDPRKPDYIPGRDEAAAAVASAASAAAQAQRTADAAVSDAADASAAAAAAREAAEAARLLALGKTDLLGFRLTLSQNLWQENLQTLPVPAVTENQETCHLIPCAPDPDNSESYYTFGLCCQAQGQGSVTFSCRQQPDRDITVNLLVLLQGVAE